MTTVAATIIDCLQANWGGAVVPAAADIIFSDEWYRSRDDVRDKPQVTVTGPVSSRNRFFGPAVTPPTTRAPGLHLFSFQHYRVNVWVTIPRGKYDDDEAVEYTYAEDMRNEIVRILNEQRCSCYADPLGIVVPLDQGVGRHEFNRTPRMLRYEILVQVNRKT
jgi:hypothetical protein